MDFFPPHCHSSDTSPRHAIVKPLEGSYSPACCALFPNALPPVFRVASTVPFSSSATCSGVGVGEVLGGTISQWAWPCGPYFLKPPQFCLISLAPDSFSPHEPIPESRGVKIFVFGRENLFFLEPPPQHGSRLRGFTPPHPCFSAFSSTPTPQSLSFFPPPPPWKKPTAAGFLVERI